MRWRLLLLAAAILLVFVPNFHTFTTHVVGAPQSDALKHVWSQWLVRDQISRGAMTMHTELLHFPAGGPFFSLDTVNALIGLPLTLVASPITTFNLLLLLSLVGAGLAGAALTRELTHAPWADVVGGLGFALSAWMLAFPLASGVTETIATWPMPLALLFAWRALTRPAWHWPVLAGLMLSLQGLACWSHGITAGLLLLGMVVVVWRRRPELFTDKRLWMRAATMGVSALVVALPLYWAVSGTVSADDAIKARTLSLFHSAPIGPLAVPEANSMALADFISPGRWGLRVSQAGTEQLQYAIYPGVVLIGLGVLGVRSRAPAARALLIGSVLMALLAMGPRLYLDHGRTIGGLPNPVYLLAYWAIPLVNATIHSVDRFAVGLQLCLAMLAAVGVSHIRAPLRPWAAAALLAEVLWVSPGPWPLGSTSAEAHPASQYLAEHPREGAVVDWPFETASSQGTWFIGDIFLQQTHHRRPIPFQLEGRGIETVSPPMATNPFFHRVSSSLLYRHPLVPECSGTDALADMGVAFVVWRRESTPPSQREDLDRVLRLCLGPPQAFEDRWVFELPK